MKATGRRAWRKWAKRRRRLYAQLQKSLSVSSKSDPSPYRGVICRRKKKAAEGRGPRAVPVKPFTARSLVGMTMGARKRAAWAEYQGAILAQDGEEIGSWDDARAKYRIGQRLRPCPGCPACTTSRCQWGVGPGCMDGSGVLPAKRSARVPKLDMLGKTVRHSTGRVGVVTGVITTESVDGHDLTRYTVKRTDGVTGSQIWHASNCTIVEAATVRQTADTA